MMADITKEQALAELARRELAKRGVSLTTNPSESTDKPVKRGLVEGLVSKVMGPEWDQARQDFENYAPGMIDRARFRGELGGSILAGMGTGAALRGAITAPSAVGKALPLAKQALIGAGEGLVGSQILSGDASERIRNAILATSVGGAAPYAVKGITSALKPVGTFFNKTFEFGGKDKLRQLAYQAKRNLDNAYRGFNKEYEGLFESKPPIEKLPQTHIDSIQNKALEVLDRVPEKTPASSLLEKIVGQSDNLTPRELHSLKQDLFKRAKGLTPDQKSALMEVYDEATKVLGSKDVYGDAYTALSGRYKKFVTQEANYVSDNIYDKFGNPSEEYLKKNHFTQNEINAFKKLESRTGSKPTIKRVGAVNRAEKLKLAGKGLIGTAIGGGVTKGVYDYLTK